ncbi:cyclic peptide export ABC transporter [Noviherbaspirillum sp. CPCC 100848]|uniref:Cyclic peptide export ABC transporter n=1 Tax=Noviherbaspirillum album TaxID=3080276 RepID=A0ABU6JBS1_9BURK|nr:cyclic peptide export ABC transporter [Noviherbaspirillum sp. CPCC 100848]MEC4720702.1 cyclic peptide export ABC transporter [Noviherbaspirillum sp. CPCC 100848]
MRLTELLFQDTRTSIKRLGLMAVIAGGASAGILAIVNAAAQVAGDSSGHAQYVAFFGIALIAYVFSQRYVLTVTTDEVERIVDGRRRGLIRKLAACELQGVEKIGHGVIFTAINSDAQTISQTAGSLILGVQALILMFWTAIYLATLSLPTLALVAVVLLIASRIYNRKIERARTELRRAHHEVTALHEVVEGLLGGFKEVKLSSRRASELLQDAMLVSERTALYRSLAQRALAANFIFSQVAIFVLLGTLVFVLPVISTTFADTTVKALAAVLFLIGPISGIISSVPQITVANAAAENLLRLEQLLDEHVEAGRRTPDGEIAAPGDMQTSSDFKVIELRQLRFSRGQGSERFSVGPIDLTIREGETIFITGGNGSGKTTFVKMLTGLYPADSGEILIDGMVVGKLDMQRYRDMFGAVFSDFHLFSKLYGVDDVDQARGAGLIDEMEIENKVVLEGRRFSTVDLSTGQRKRLALVAVQLEERPIIILDEWAADQDPHFRAKFYETLLPSLKAAGATVIAITHDDKYFHHADRRLHMADGRITEMSMETA